MSRTTRYVIAMALPLLLLVFGCPKRHQRKIECIDGNARLQQILADHTRFDPTAPIDDLHLGLTIVESNMEALELELNRLLLICPANDELKLVRATVAIADRDRPEATRILDELLARRPSYPEAALLRSRLAIEVGGIGYARELLERQIRFKPDSTILYEALGAALFADGEHDAALRKLDRAEELGAPTWRIDFNRGLIAEDRGEIELAKLHYERSYRANPVWADSLARLRGLGSRPSGTP